MPTNKPRNPSRIIIFLDMDTRITAISRALPAALGDCKPTDLIGQPIDCWIRSIAAIESAADTSTDLRQQLRQLAGQPEALAAIHFCNGSILSAQLYVDELCTGTKRGLTLTLSEPPIHSATGFYKARLEQIFGKLGWAVGFSSNLQTIEYATPAFAALHGYTCEEMTGMSLEGLDPNRRPGETHLHARQVNDWGGLYYETTHRHRLGHQVPIAVSVATIYNDDGSVDFCLGHLTDITERKQLEEKLHLNNEFLQLIYRHAPVAMATCDLKGRFVSVNSALIDMLGYSERELLELGFTDITHPDDVAANIDWHQRTMRENLDSYQLEKRYLHKDGRIVWAFLVVSWIRNADGTPRCSIGQIFDLESANGQRVSRAFSQRDNLIREVHHRIKNNLQSVTGLLRRQISTNPAASDTLQQAISQVEAIAIVHGLQSNADRRRLRVCEMLGGIIDESNRLLGDNRQIQSPELLKNPAQVHAEEAVPVALICSELITNAIKHHCPASPFAVEVTIERLDHERVQIVVANPADPLPVDFDFAAGRGIGQGLKLVRAMQPKSGMNVFFNHLHGNLRATMLLQPPIIYPEFADHPSASADSLKDL